MAKLSRLLDLATRAAGKAASSRSASGSSSGGRDWRDMVRTAADAVTGERRDAPALSSPPSPTAAPGARYAPPAGSTNLTAEDRAAIARYDYLLRTADPDQVERLHRESFDRLTPAQRAEVRRRMDAEFAPHERPRSDASGDLARAAGRAEARRPGRMSGLLARAGAGGLVGAGVVGAEGLLAVVAGGAVVSAVAGPLLAQAAQLGTDFTGLAAGVDLEALASGADLASLVPGTEALGDAVGGVQETVGEQVSGLGDRLGGFEIPGLGDFFGR
ncbi:cation-transporting ATPase [Microbacterium sp. RURRCA19A]|uniref:cation-transporting ATPase n=1 Tax=Microbacterium sp. RURRCA19A TaxID=1907391 RepID=UPI000954D589|nr:cation-transporting ATPase [Microbacterium sp. RURRCA19A]SIR51701.1 hypothetical protein SAMN05880568_0279 [Microbacterium sp. RURRCA19A]